MKDRVTLLQAVLLILAVLAIGSLVFLAREQAPNRPEAGSHSSEAGATGEDPTVAYVRFVTATSDSLHDAAESLVVWLQSVVDTTGLSTRTADLSGQVDRSMASLERGVGLIALEEYDLLASLFLDYLDAPALALEEVEAREHVGNEYLRKLEVSRREIEGRLMRYIGAF